jgi:hypothetical protein
LTTEVRKGPWLIGTTRYKDFPLALRVRPDSDTPTNRARLASLGVVTHFLAKVRDDGLPEPEYNDSLEDFDIALQEAMAGGEVGIVVLVETFAGKRTYYAYVNDCASFRSRVHSLRQQFQEHELTIECEADAPWKFYERYRKNFPW